MNCGCSTNTNSCCETTGQHVGAKAASPREVFKPAVDITETPESFTVHADLPGVCEQDVDVRFEEGTLTIAAKVADRATHGRPIAREYAVGDFERSFRIGEGIDVSQISAELKHGVLTLTLPRSERTKPRKIEVRTA